MRATRFDRRRGVTLVEVVIVAVLLSFVLLCLLMLIPQSRENARLANCQSNLMRIGQVVAHYDANVGHLPATGAAGSNSPGPLATILGQFGLGDLSQVSPANKKWATKGATTATEHFVRDFVCPADPRAMRSKFPAPVSYRGNSGPGTAGQGGPFAFGQSTRIADAEASAGSDFTASFAERLVGSGSNASASVNNYLSQPGPIGSSPCPTGGSDVWLGNAGASWAVSDWQSSLYNHAMTPNEQPSCIAQDGKTARMGTSSGHAGRVNVLMLGGSVRGFSTTVDPDVWKKFAGVSPGDRGSEPAPPPTPTQP